MQFKRGEKDLSINLWLLIFSTQSVMPFLSVGWVTDIVGVPAIVFSFLIFAVNAYIMHTYEQTQSIPMRY
jgi:hypothetical protein